MSPHIPLVNGTFTVSYKYGTLPIMIEFSHGLDWVWPRKLRKLLGFPLPLLRESTVCVLRTPNGFVSEKVRRNPKDAHSWKRARKEALRKLLRENFPSRLDRPWRKAAMVALEEAL